MYNTILSLIQEKKYFIIWKSLFKWLIAWYIAYLFVNFLFFFPMEDWPLYNVIVFLGAWAVKGISAIIGIIAWVLIWRRILMQNASKLESSTSIKAEESVTVSHSKTQRLYKILCYITYPGIFLLLILLFLFSKGFCINIGWSGLGSQMYGDIGCTQGSNIIIMVFIWMLFAGLPIWIFVILVQIAAFMKNIWLKFLFSLPIFLAFIYILSALLLIIDKSWLIFILFLIGTLIWLWVFFAERKEDKVPLLFTPPTKGNGNSLLENELSKIDISSIEYIHFHEIWWKSYKIALDSIKTIAVYFYQKTNKTSFLAGELSEERNFLLKNYPSNLGIEDYNNLISHLWNWVTVGGSFEIIYK